MLCLEDEISHLQKENSRIENQIFRMKGDMVMGEMMVGDMKGGLMGAEEDEEKDGRFTYLLPLI